MPTEKIAKTIMGMLGTGHWCAVRWLRGIWVSPMAIVSVSPPIQWALGKELITNFEWAVKLAQWLLGSPKFLIAIFLGTNGLFPAHHNTLRSNRFGKSI